MHTGREPLPPVKPDELGPRHVPGQPLADDVGRGVGRPTRLFVVVFVIGGTVVAGMFDNVQDRREREGESVRQFTQLIGLKTDDDAAAGIG